MSVDSEIGPQNPENDESFTARMRRHQSWYRAARLRLGYGFDADGRPFGNLLLPDDARAGRNFFSAEIAEVARRCAAFNRDIDRPRLMSNLLSSQPMSFNLFAPLALDNGLAVRLLTALSGRTVADVTRVAFEYAPAPRSKYLSDGTAFDVFIEFRSVDGLLRFIGIEVKLSEPFSTHPYPLSVRLAYEHWVDHFSAPWAPVHRGHLDAVVHNQLWRDHMLAFALKEVGPEGYASGELFLIRHHLDMKTALAVDGYTALLKDTDTTFTDLPLDQLMAAWKPVVSGTIHEAWLSECDQRYVDIRASDSKDGQA